MTLTRTDSGVDMLLEAAERPGLGALEALAGFAESCDLARIVWRSSGEEILVVERRPVRVLLSGVAVPYPPGAFLQASEAAEAILVGRGARRHRARPSGARSLRRARHLHLRAGRSAGRYMRSKATNALRPRSRAPQPVSPHHRRAARPRPQPAAARGAFRLRRRGVRSAARRRRAASGGTRRLGARRRSSLSPATPRPLRATPPG